MYLLLYCVQSSEFYLFRIFKQHQTYSVCQTLLYNHWYISIVYNTCITIILLSEQTNVKSGAEEETATKTIDSVQSSEAASSSRVCQPSDAPKSESPTKTSKPGLINGLTSITALDEKEKIGKNMMHICIGLEDAWKWNTFQFQMVDLNARIFVHLQICQWRCFHNEHKYWNVICQSFSVLCPQLKNLRAYIKGSF